MVQKRSKISQNGQKWIPNIELGVDYSDKPQHHKSGFSLTIYWLEKDLQNPKSQSKIFLHHGRGRFLVHKDQFLTDSDT